LLRNAIDQQTAGVDWEMAIGIRLKNDF